jgi:hypothetical protein
MGLDMFAFATDSNIPYADFECPDDAEQIHYWRKHPNLHGWMRGLYERKGGDDLEFNCVNVQLKAADLDALEQAVTYGALPPTAGFFFGTSDGSERPDDLEFIHKARAKIASGRRVYYTSWW